MKRLFTLLILVAAFACGTHFEDTNTNFAPENLSQQIDSSSEMLSVYMVEYIKHRHDSTPLTIRNRELKSNKLIKGFYELRQFFPAWTYNYRPTKKAYEFIKLIENAHLYGLDSTTYKVHRLKKIAKRLNKAANKVPKKRTFKNMVEYELTITESALLFMQHLHRGIIESDTLIYGKQKIAYDKNYIRILDKAIEAKSFTDNILMLQPKNQRYKLLQVALEKYYKTNKITDDTLSIPDYKEDSVNAYKKVDKLLVYFGHLEADTAARKDSAFTLALKEFQLYNGLKQDGKLGKHTVASLVLNKFDRFQKIVVTLERMRWENDFPYEYVLVNIPSYKLKVIKNKRTITLHKVIVGLPYLPTPTLTSQIEHFITYPVWHVPYSISTREILPKIKRDSNYLSKSGYRVYDKDRKKIDAATIDWNNITKNNFDYHIRQSSGRYNSLGTIKFIFPNPHHVYLHDTPSKRLFKNDRRAYSHGCMRLMKPADFGKFLLLNEERTEEAQELDSLMKYRKSRRINLKNKLPIYVRYYTCEADSSGNIFFYQDIYKRDKKLLDKMKNELNTRNFILSQNVLENKNSAK